MLWTKCKAVMAMVLVAGLATGCSQQKMSMENMKAPERPKELDKLDFFVGTWTGTSEMKMPGCWYWCRVIPSASMAWRNCAGGGVMCWRGAADKVP